MKKQFAILLLCCFAVLVPVAGSGQEPGNGDLGIVSAPLANVHADGPASRSRLETQVLMGDEVRILEKQDNRYRVTIPNQENREGWIQQEAVHIPKDKGRSYLNANRQWIVITAPKAEAMILDRTGDHKVSLYARHAAAGDPDNRNEPQGPVPRPVGCDHRCFGSHAREAL